MYKMGGEDIAAMPAADGSRGKPGRAGSAQGAVSAAVFSCGQA